MGGATVWGGVVAHSPRLVDRGVAHFKQTGVLLLPTGAAVEEALWYPVECKNNKVYTQVTTTIEPTEYRAR